MQKLVLYKASGQAQVKTSRRIIYKTLPRSSFEPAISKQNIKRGELKCTIVIKRIFEFDLIAPIEHHLIFERIRSA